MDIDHSFHEICVTIECLSELMDKREMNTPEEWNIQIHCFVKNLMKTNDISKISKAVRSIFRYNLNDDIKRLCKEDMIFKQYITLIIQNSSIEDLQSDSVNLYNILEPISYL